MGAHYRDAVDAHLAQINIGTMLAATDDPSVAEFMDNLERVNAIADAAPGFVWRLQTDSGNATEIQIFPNPLTLVNMSVWESVDALKEYVYRSDHVDFFRRRAAWFEPDAKRVALWYLPAGKIPELDEAVRRVEFLERNGPTPYAFGFGKPQVPLVFEATTPDDPETGDMIERLNHELSIVATHACENHFALGSDEVSGDRGRHAPCPLRRAAGRLRRGAHDRSRRRRGQAHVRRPDLSRSQARRSDPRPARTARPPSRNRRAQARDQRQAAGSAAAIRRVRIRTM